MPASYPAGANPANPEFDESLLQQVQQALLDERQLHYSYLTAHNNKHRELVFSSLALIQRGDITYPAKVTEPNKDFRLGDYIASGTLQFTSLELVPPPCRPVPMKIWLGSCAIRRCPATCSWNLKKRSTG